VSQVVFVPHGGGPKPVLGDPHHAELVSYLKALQPAIAKAKALLVITAHWEAPEVAISAQAQPGMLYDYSNFPEQAYRLQYPVPGAPDLAIRVQAMLAKQGIDATLDHQRGYDHGTFIPLMLMAPEAHIPVLQLSLMSDLNPQAHINMGKALAPLLAEGVMILGSGLSFHSFPAMRSADKAEPFARSKRFDDWLNATILSTDRGAAEQQLANWEQAPEARYSHPREEHLLPLHVCFGAAMAGGLTPSNFYQGQLFGVMNSGFIW